MQQKISNMMYYRQITLFCLLPKSAMCLFSNKCLMCIVGKLGGGWWRLWHVTGDRYYMRKKTNCANFSWMFLACFSWMWLFVCFFVPRKSAHILARPSRVRGCPNEMIIKYHDWFKGCGDVKLWIAIRSILPSGWVSLVDFTSDQATPLIYLSPCNKNNKLKRRKKKGIYDQPKVHFYN